MQIHEIYTKVLSENRIDVLRTSEQNISIASQEKDIDDAKERRQKFYAIAETLQIALKNGIHVNFKIHDFNGDITINISKSSKTPSIYVYAGYRLKEELIHKMEVKTKTPIDASELWQLQKNAASELGILEALQLSQTIIDERIAALEKHLTWLQSEAI